MLEFMPLCVFCRFTVNQCLATSTWKTSFSFFNPQKISETIYKDLLLCFLINIKKHCTLTMKVSEEEKGSS